MPVYSTVNLEKNTVKLSTGILMKF